MPSETLHFETARLAQQLFNHEPRNLQALEDQLGVKATAREGWIKLEGTADGLERAKHLFISLENSIKAGAPVRNREFMQALDIVKQKHILGAGGSHHQSRAFATQRHDQAGLAEIGAQSLERLEVDSAGIGFNALKRQARDFRHHLLHRGLVDAHFHHNGDQRLSGGLLHHALR